MMSKKEKWLLDTIKSIESKNLKEPIQLNKHTIITDLDKTLKSYKQAIMNTTNRRILSSLCDKLIEINKYEAP